MKNIILLILVAVLGVGVACNRSRGNPSSSEQQSSPSTTQNQTDKAQMSSADHEFVMNAAKGGKAEVELGNLASQRASTPAVKQFGQKMVTDHSEANNKLQQIAQQKGMTLPNDLPDDAKQLKDRLSQEKGIEFDRDYMQNMVQDHQKDVAEFQKEADQGQDPEIKNFAASTLPTIKQHLQLAQTTLSQIQK